MKINPKSFEDRFEQLVVQQFNIKLGRQCTSIQEVVEQYGKLTMREQYAVFADKVDNKAVHTMDLILGKQPYKYISYSRKHFQEVTIPKYTFKKWTQALTFKLVESARSQISAHIDGTLSCTRS